MVNKPLPQHVKNQIWEESHLELEWWGRRPFYEIIEPLADSLANLYICFSSFLALSHTFGWSGQVYWGSCAVVMLLISSKAYYDIKTWWHECHVVFSDTSKAGEGRYYKFEGWLKRQEEPVMVKGSSPTTIVDEPIWYRVWNIITGDQMILFTMHVPTMDAAVVYRIRMHRDLSKAIDRVWNSKKKDQKDKEIMPDLDNALIIDQLMRRGSLDSRQGREAIERLVANVVP